MRRRVDEVVPFEDGLIIYQPGRDRLHHLNRTALHILELSAAERSPAAIAEALMRAYGLPSPPVEEVAMIQATLASEQLDSLPEQTCTRPGSPYITPSIQSFPIDGLADFLPLWVLQDSPVQGPPREADSS
ncbi:MAG: PqqD family protein [bacterium]|nr:PqqD family protein [bacterium]